MDKIKRIKKWQWWTIGAAAIVLIGAVGAAFGGGSDTPATPESTAAVVEASPQPEASAAAIVVPDVVGLPANEAKELLIQAGFLVALESDDGAVLMAKNWDVTDTHPAAGVTASEGATITAKVEKATDRIEAEQAAALAEREAQDAAAKAEREAQDAEYAAAPVDGITARALCSATAEYEYPYGIKEHWFAEGIDDKATDTGWRLRVGVTITNAFGTEYDATMQCLVGGTNAAPVMDEFLVY